MADNKPRCSKCGRPLSNPVSIARGMGPVCAGLTGRGGGRSSSKSSRSPRVYCVASTSGYSDLPLFAADDDEDKNDNGDSPEDDVAEKTQQEKFESHEPFRIGSDADKPVICKPADDDKWVCGTRTMSHTRMRLYLERYVF
ncbi:MAG: DUF6011 domain-containing protein [Chloroflexota bacterium]|nr:DUF6011 domain-containing protein [Chloroflexota bacterium]